MDNLGTAMILLGFSIFIFAVMYKLRDTKKKRKKKVNFLKVAGIALIAFGIYELPWGVMEVYGITQSAFHLSLLENYVLWSAICMTAITAGFLIYRRARK